MRATRRRFLKTAACVSTVCAMDRFAPQFLLRAAEQADRRNGDDRVLVVVQLNGGNDGLNTVVPFRNDDYYKNRPKLAIGADRVHKFHDDFGFHPSMSGVAELMKEGLLSIVQGVGYPDPNRSHFESMDIWHTCQRKEQRSQDGWLGRYLDRGKDRWGSDSPAIHLGAEKQPYALVAQHVRTPSVASVEKFRLHTEKESAAAESIRKLANAERSETSSLLDFVSSSTQSALDASERIEAASKSYQPATEYPESGLAGKLRTVAQLLDAGFRTRVYYVELDNFDTHSQQPDAHAALLTEYSNAVNAFWTDIAKHGHGDRVVVMTFSEFGRRVRENASEGTDHGAAAPMFLLGKKVQSGIVGALPSLTDLDDGDLKHHTDFRQVFASVLEGWLGCESESILGGKYAPVGMRA